MTQKMELSHCKSLLSTDGFLPIAHRGASNEFPENTIEAFTRALEIIPSCMLEMDLWMSKDGEVIVGHDEDLSITTSGKGAIHSLTCSELMKLEAGHNISFDDGLTYPFRGKGCRLAKFQDVLQKFPNAPLSIDIKYNNEAFADSVVSMIRENNAGERTLIGSFHDKISKKIRRDSPELVRYFGKGDIIRFVLFQKLGMGRFYKGKDDVMSIPEFSRTNTPEYLAGKKYQGVRIITPRLITNAGKKGIPVLAWTINNESNMERLIDWGVNGIFTDDLETLKKVMKRKDML